ARNFGTNKLLIEVYLANHEMNKEWKDDPKFQQVKFVKPPFSPDRIRDSVMKAVIKSISEEQLSISKMDKKLNFVVVEMRDSDELFAKEFVERLMENASGYYIDYKSKKSRKNFDLIYRLTDSVRGLLYGNIERYASTADLNINPLRQVAKTGSQKIQMNAQANTALYTELLKQLGLAQISLQKETPLIQVIDQPILPLKKKKPGRLLTGIIFAFVGGIACIVFLLIIKWIKDSDNRLSRSGIVAE
ncbi:MAG: lipopolysaccharide biosynthesis protein, partial [Segetibacter sp.]|nr:lipopolysaccharide biosynthesis protein [Segetibacter sp.]